MLAVNGVAKMRPKKPVKAVTTGSDGLRYAIDANGKLWTRGGIGPFASRLKFSLK